VITAACILLVAALTAWATRAWMIADLEEAEDRADRAGMLARHYRDRYCEAISGVPVSNEADEMWAEFLRGPR
jgi:hypothetical protein